MYQKRLNALLDSAKEVGIDVNYRIYEDKYTWQQATQLKSKYILEKLKEYDGTPVVYLDADALIHQYPALFDSFEQDVALAYFRLTFNPWFAGRKKNELISATLYFGNKGDDSKDLVAHWIQQCKENKNTWDQTVLQNIVDGKTGFRQVKYGSLPFSYCYIFDSTIKDFDGSPVISQTQASREFRDKYPKKVQ